jgi:hypothetical protein
MESVAAVIGITEATVRTASKLWKLTNAWRDAPEDVHRLRDDITRTQQFFGEIRHHTLLANKSEDAWDQSSPFETELKLLLDGGIAVLGRIETFVDSLLGDQPTDGAEALLNIGKRRRLVWIANTRKVTQMRRDLRLKASNICHMLITQNM